MRSGTHGLRAVVLAAMAVLGLMAFGTVGAWAQTLPGASTPGEFLVNLGVPNGDAATAFQLGSGYLLIAARDKKVQCNSLDVNSILINNSTDATVAVTFLECILLTHAGGTAKGCVLKELETIKASALALPILHGGERFVLFEPLAGTELANIRIKPETVCPLPLNSPITGSIVAKVQGELEGTVQTLVFSEAIQLLSGDVLKYGALANTAYLNGTVDVELEGFGKLGVH
jgi:hypothetical protein